MRVSCTCTVYVPMHDLSVAPTVRIHQTKPSRWRCWHLQSHIISRQLLSQYWTPEQSCTATLSNLYIVCYCDNIRSCMHLWPRMHKEQPSLGGTQKGSKKLFFCFLVTRGLHPQPPTLDPGDHILRIFQLLHRPYDPYITHLTHIIWTVQSI